MAYQIKGKYIDYGESLVETGVADGAVVYSSWIDDAWWIKRIVLKIQSSQPYTVFIKRRNSSNVEDWSSQLTTGLGATSTAYAGLAYDGASATMGYSFAIGLRNDNGSGGTADFKCEIEGLGDQ